MDTTWRRERSRRPGERRVLEAGIIRSGGPIMPVHDWTRVSAGTFHAFHVSWISEIQASLNSGVLPRDYYAQAEQIAGPFAPDILTLQATDRLSNGAPSAGTNG